MRERAKIARDLVSRKKSLLDFYIKWLRGTYVSFCKNFWRCLLFRLRLVNGEIVARCRYILDFALSSLSDLRQWNEIETEVAV